MSTKIKIGNDIVSLQLNGTSNKHKDERFVNRVFAPDEINAIQNYENPNHLLWMFWSAKEAAYKVVKKLETSTIFSHSRFVVDHENGIVRYKDLVIHVKWIQEEDYVSCVACNQKTTQIQTRILKMSDAFFASCDISSFTEKEKQSIKSEESLKVRYLAKEMLRELGFGDCEIVREKERGNWGPPKGLKKKQEIQGVDVSLSHHGEWVCASLAL